MGAKPESGELNKALRPLFSNLPAVHVIHHDLVVATSTLEEHKDATIEALQTILQSGLTLNPDKCRFDKKEIPFWGMIISGDGVRPDPSKVEALQNATRPESKSELMSFCACSKQTQNLFPTCPKKKYTCES